MGYEIKLGVVFHQTIYTESILSYVVPAYQTLGVPCVITSAMEGVHQNGSRHYVGRALDFRTHGMSKETIEDLARVIRSAGGESLNVVVESDHLHVGYVPPTK